MLDISSGQLSPKGKIHKNLGREELVKLALSKEGVKQAANGAIVAYTGKYTGRSPNDRFIVESAGVRDEIDWGSVNPVRNSEGSQRKIFNGVNVPLSEESFEKLYKKITTAINNADEVFVTDSTAGADSEHQLKVRIVSEFAYEALFARHMFRRMSSSFYSTPLTGGDKGEGERSGEREGVENPADFTVLAFPSCHAEPESDGTNSETFVAIHLEKKLVLIGGTKYCGEIKKSIFSVMNYLLPRKNVLPMHCSANMGADGRSALFFGLSGTGKTTLSSDPNRKLIGDDEHGWCERGVFNFEGGCYAKCIKLSAEKEPQIWNAIKAGALLENVVLKDDGEPDYDDASLTENTRAAYPIEYITDFVPEGAGGHPSAIIFLTADAFGVLPPVAKLDELSCQYHFLSGYTSKLAGTERGVGEPKATFSACFGAPFMPLPPQVYANLLAEYIKKYNSEVYLVNTGWFGGAFGSGKRIDLPITRKIVDEILSGNLKNAEWKKDELFNLDVVKSFAGIDDSVWNYAEAWPDQSEYQNKSRELAALFRENFRAKYPNAPEEVLAKGPKI